MNHAEEAFSVVLPADHQPTEVMKPSNKSLHSPPPAVAPQGTAILSRLPALPAMWSDHRDAIALGQISTPAVAVAGFVPDQSCGKGCRGKSVRGRLRRVGFRVAKRFR